MNEKDIITLSIETSCDETAAAITKNGREVLASVVATQIDLHKKYGGVVPEIASRKHLESIMPVIDETLEEWNQNCGGVKEDIDLVAVTYGPGLVGALLVGMSAGKAMAYALNKPLIAVNHIEGHIAAAYITYLELEPPFVCLIVSGGHSHVVLVKDYIQFEILGRTRDDAAGEAYDKIARVLGLGYPGGPEIDNRAIANPKSMSELPQFPRVNFSDGTSDFSFSGVKTSVMNYINKEQMQGREIFVDDICAGFQTAVSDVLVQHTLDALTKCKKNISNPDSLNKIAVVGGVAANKGLRAKMKELCDVEHIELFIPDFELCTDNAAMIGAAGYYSFINGRKISGLDLNAIPNLKLGE